MSFFSLKPGRHSKPIKGGSRVQDVSFQSSTGKYPASEASRGGDGPKKLLHGFRDKPEKPRGRRDEATPYNEDSIIGDEHEGKVRISLVQAISDAIRPALELGYDNAFEHPEDHEDRSIPVVLRQARLLAERYEKLVDKVGDSRDLDTPAPLSRETMDLYGDLQKSKKQCAEMNSALKQQAVNHSLRIEEIFDEHKKELRREHKHQADALQDQKETYEMYLQVEKHKGLGWYQMHERLEKEQLPQLKKEISQLRNQYWELHAENKVLLGKQEDHEGLREKYRQLEKEHQRLQVIQQDHEVAMEQTLKKHNLEIEQKEEKYRAEIKRLKESQDVVVQQIQRDHSDEIRTLEEKHETGIRRLRNEQSSRIDRLQKGWNDKANQYEAEMTQLKEDVEAEKAEADAIHAAAKKQWETEKLLLQEDFEVHRAKLESIHADAMNKVNVQKQQMKDDFAAQKRKLKDDFEARKAELDSLHVDAMKQIEAEKSQMAMEMKALEDRLNKTHAQETDRLKREIQSRNKAFVARDTFVPITDGGLKSAFFDILREVDTLSRLKWAFNNSPWTDDFQEQITDNPKRLQRHILQDTIWGVLFECIFCSPFRVFGTEGKVLETQWNDACGKHRGSKNEFYTWPEANFGAEKWRYETMRSCQETLTTTTSAYDPRTKLREAYSKSVDAIQEKIQAPLKMVSDLDPSMTKSIRGLIDKAAKTWILFGTQRCRILVVMQDLKTETESNGNKGAQTESVELVLRPELRRIGDSDGGSLEKEQVVAGCEGEAKRIMYSSS